MFLKYLTVCPFVYAFVHANHYIMPAHYYLNSDFISQQLSLAIIIKKLSKNKLISLEFRNITNKNRRQIKIQRRYENYKIYMREKTQ